MSSQFRFGVPEVDVSDTLVPFQLWRSMTMVAVNNSGAASDLIVGSAAGYGATQVMERLGSWLYTQVKSPAARETLVEACWRIIPRAAR